MGDENNFTNFEKQKVPLWTDNEFCCLKWEDALIR